MSENAVEQLTPRITTPAGLLFLVLLAGLVFGLFGKEPALGMVVGMIVGLVNFKAMALIIKRILGPDTVHKVMFGIFGFLKFLILVLVFFVLVYYKIFHVYGILAGFTAVLLLALIEGLIRANRYSREEYKEEKINA
jgi:hypothetical protein